MTVATQKETRGFQTEAKQLLHLMIHSLYSNKEIFLRELVSNASDAADKLRFEAITHSDYYEDDAELKIRIIPNKEKRTLTIIDNGIGMSRDEVVEHLGTIAKSGTSQFTQNLTGDEQKDSQLIGQFGVGFYSAFIVSKKVEVLTRRAGLDAEAGVHWVCDGEAEFTVETVDKAERGTTIILHLKKAALEFAEPWRVRSVIKKYSDHISIPVQMLKEADEKPKANDKDSEGDGSEDETTPDSTEPKVPEFETVNEATALWTRSKSDISDDEYKEFYKHLSNDFSEPMRWSHNRVEGKLDYTSLLYIPNKPPFDLYNRDSLKGLKLYVQRTFIMDDAEQFLPLYLRFVKGVVDSNDLSLNVSREILQKDPNIDAMRSALTKRILDMLGKIAKNEPEDYKVFWKAFGQVMKEGPVEDYNNREKIAKLLRFNSTHSEGDEQNVSLEDYKARMPEGQDKIYFISAENHVTAKSSPHLEVFRKKGLEVLLLCDKVDEWLMGHMPEFDGIAFQDVGKGSLNLSELDSEEEKQAQEQIAKDNEDLIERVKGVLGEEVEDVRVTNRLTDSPACLVMDKDEMGAQLRRMLKQAGQEIPNARPIFEINAEHPLLRKLDMESDEDRFEDVVRVLFDQANLAEGGQLADPAAFVRRLNKLLLDIKD